MNDLGRTEIMIGIRRPLEVREGGPTIICCITLDAARELEGVA